MMTDDNKRGIGQRALAQAIQRFGHLAHRNVEAVLEPAKIQFPRLAHVEHAMRDA